MTQSLHKVTFEESQKLQQGEEAVHYELDEGELIEMTPANYEHKRIRGRIEQRPRNYLETQNLGEVVAEMDFRLSVEVVRTPDIPFIAAEHLQNVHPEDAILNGAPALAVEIISPSNTASEIVRKRSQYLAAGPKPSGWSIPSSAK